VENPGDARLRFAIEAAMLSYGLPDECIQIIDRLEAENSRLRAALSFYALMQNYAPNQGGAPPSPILEDCGDRARKALERMQG